jgi:hypothetical protein
MKRILERFEAMAMAVTFAEAGEWETAKQMMEKNNSKKNHRTEQTQLKKKNQFKRPRVQL